MALNLQRARKIIVCLAVILTLCSPLTLSGVQEAQAAVPCTPLHVVAVPGTFESTPRASTNADSNYLGWNVTRPLLNRASGLVSRQFITYPADFGFAGHTYQESLSWGINALKRTVSSYASRCPSSSIAIVGFSQGAQVADTVLKYIGSGKGPIPSNRLAAGALFSSPIRPQGSGTFMDSRARRVPAAPPRVAQSSLDDLVVVQHPSRYSAGTSPDIAAGLSYGPIAARVASYCSTGDLVCSMHSYTALARVFAFFAEQFHNDYYLSDPLQVLFDFDEMLQELRQGKVPHKSSHYLNTLRQVFQIRFRNNQSYPIEYIEQQLIGVVHEIRRMINQEKDFFSILDDLHYWNHGNRHQSYNVVPIDSSGRTSTQYTVEWFTRLAQQL